MNHPLFIHYHYYLGFNQQLDAGNHRFERQTAVSNLGSSYQTVRFASLAARFFSETGAGKHVPRCVMVDLEPTVPSHV